MPNHHPSEQIELLQEELATVRADSALVVYALDCAIQLTDALIRFLPDGTALSGDVVTCKHRLDEAMHNIRRKP